jgi:DNA-binding response OmpR family regulator
MRKILLVEDEEILRDTYLTILSSEPYIVESAVNGQDALDKCSTKTYDLILLDLMMPIVDGVGFLQQFSSPRTKIIVLSNLSSGDLLNTAMELGADKSALKADLSPKQLLSLVRYELQAN